MTSDKSLKKKAIKIKGKDYVLVSDRVNYFNETYENGSIKTQLVSEYQDSLIVIKATVTPDVGNPDRVFTGYSQAIVGDGMVNKTAALENAETSAVGRALGLMGIGVIESIASADEMNKTTYPAERKFATDKQISWLRVEASRVSGLDQQDDIDGWVEKNIGAKPDKLSVGSVKKAVDKIRQIGEEMKGTGPLPTTDVTDEDVDDFNKGEIPY